MQLSNLNPTPSTTPNFPFTQHDLRKHLGPVHDFVFLFPVDCNKTAKPNHPTNLVFSTNCIAWCPSNTAITLPWSQRFSRCRGRRRCKRAVNSPLVRLWRPRARESLWDQGTITSERLQIISWTVRCHLHHTNFNSQHFSWVT